MRNIEGQRTARAQPSIYLQTLSKLIFLKYITNQVTFSSSCEMSMGYQMRSAQETVYGPVQPENAAGLLIVHVPDIALLASLQVIVPV